MDGIASDKVNINVGEGGGRGGYDSGASIAAIIAALGNRNQGNDNAALIAALGNRNDGLHRGDDGFGFGGGGGILGLVALLGLLRGRGGLGGDDCGGGHHDIGRDILLSKLGTIEGAVPLAAAEVGNDVCRATGEITNSVNQAQLALLAANSNLKDTVQNGFALSLTNAAQNTKEILGAICALSGKIDQNQIMDLQRQLGVAQAAAAEERNNHRIREVEVSVSQNVNQQQSQAQLQAQIGGLLAGFNVLSAQVQRVRADQDIVNLGTMVASGTQATTSTQVR